MLADGKINATPLVTGTVGLDGVADAFESLADPGAHAKIIIDPSSTAALQPPRRPVMVTSPTHPGMAPRTSSPPVRHGHVWSSMSALD